VFLEDHQAIRDDPARQAFLERYAASETLREGMHAADQAQPFARRACQQRRKAVQPDILLCTWYGVL